MTDLPAGLREYVEALELESSTAREYNKLRCGNVPKGQGIWSDWQKRLSKARAATDAAREKWERSQHAE